MQGIVVIVVDEYPLRQQAGNRIESAGTLREKLLESKIAFKVFFLHQSKKFPEHRQSRVGEDEGSWKDYPYIPLLQYQSTRLQW